MADDLKSQLELLIADNLPSAERLQKFQWFLGQLQKATDIVMVPYIKTYNSGKQEAALEFRIINNGDTQERDGQ